MDWFPFSTFSLAINVVFLPHQSSKLGVCYNFHSCASDHKLKLSHSLLQLTATTASVGMLNLALGQLGSLVPSLVSELDGHAVSLSLSVDR